MAHSLMTNFWFWTVALMLSIYVVLDGYDIGVGIVHLCISKTDRDRKTLLETIHPLWDGNEVWLIAAGTTLYFAFPKLYASSFSGFYLPLMMVLWLLILRGISIEFRDLIQSRAWIPLWDMIFSAASSALALFFGVALGNVVRGVPFDSSHNFFLPLWTNFQVTGPLGILDWYTLSVGISAWITLLVHGSLWVALRTEGNLEINALKFTRRAWPLLLIVIFGITFLSFRVQPHLEESYRLRPFGLIFPFVAFIAMIGIRIWSASSKVLKAFLCSSVFILAMLCSVSFGLFPLVLPSAIDRTLSLTVENSSAPLHGLVIGLYWFIPGIILAFAYTTFVHRKFSGKITHQL